MSASKVYNCLRVTEGARITTKGYLSKPNPATKSTATQQTAVTSITSYNAAKPSVPESIANIKISHILFRTESPFAAPPPQLHKLLADGVPALLWGKEGHVESMKVNLGQSHSDLDHRDLLVYIKPHAIISAAPGLFFVKKCTLLAPHALFKTNTTRWPSSTRRRWAPGMTSPSPWPTGS